MVQKAVESMRVPRAVLGLAIAGTGLIVLGGAIGAYLLRLQSDQAIQPTDFSAVPAAVHYAAPPLALTDLKGATQELSDLRGQVVLVNLWATWCGPCQAEMPLLQQYFEGHRESGFTIVAIEDGEPASDVRSFVAEYKLTFPVWLDPTHQATDHAFHAIGIPTSYVIDRSGQVRLMWVGAISEDNLEKYVTPLIEEK
jgi:cytochrome c biogenesis protein CcmG/thiol:disulfide interchange protein DsbE